MPKYKKSDTDSLPRNKRIMSQLVLLLEQHGQGKARCVVEAKQEILRPAPSDKCSTCKYARGSWIQYSSGEMGG